MSTVPTFRTWVTGELVTASFMNTNIRDAGNFLTAVPCFAGRQTVAQTFTTAVTAGVNLDTEDIDSDNGHSTVSSTNLYTVQTAGWFRYGGGCSFANNATGARIAWLGKNGTTAVPASAQAFVPSGTVASWMAIKSGLVAASVGDTLQVLGNQNSGGNLNTVVSGVEAQPSLNLQWVRV